MYLVTTVAYVRCAFGQRTLKYGTTSPNRAARIRHHRLCFRRRQTSPRSDGLRDALMQPVRKVQTATHFKTIRGPSPLDKSQIVNNLLTPCSLGEPGVMELTWNDVDGEKLYEPPVTMGDMLNSLSRTKPSVNDEDMKKLQKFTDEFGQEG